MALLPRQGKFFRLTTNGWRVGNYKIDRRSFEPVELPPVAPMVLDPEAVELDARPYTPLTSLWPNYIRPDLFADISDLQIGLATKSHDVSGDYQTPFAIFVATYFVAAVLVLVAASCFWRWRHGLGDPTPPQVGPRQQLPEGEHPDLVQARLGGGDVDRPRRSALDQEGAWGSAVRRPSR